MKKEPYVKDYYDDEEKDLIESGANPDPTHQARGRQFGLLSPFAHEVDNPIA